MNAPKKMQDLRAKRTELFLWDALMALLTEGRIESVTVADICGRAMVHRTTFYKHYEDKNALLYNGIQNQLNLLFEAFDSAVPQPHTRDEEQHMLVRFTTVFEHILEHERFYRLMFTGEGFGRFNLLLRRSFADRFEQRRRPAEKNASTPGSLHVQLQAAVMVAMIAWWLENDCAYSPAEMTELLQHHLTTRFSPHRSPAGKGQGKP